MDCESREQLQRRLSAPTYLILQQPWNSFAGEFNPLWRHATSGFQPPDYSKSIKRVATKTHKTPKRSSPFLSLLCLLVAIGFLETL
jgi:hypothetical protein